MVRWVPPTAPGATTSRQPGTGFGQPNTFRCILCLVVWLLLRLWVGLCLLGRLWLWLWLGIWLWLLVRLRLGFWFQFRFWFCLWFRIRFRIQLGFSPFRGLSF